MKKNSGDRIVWILNIVLPSTGTWVVVCDRQIMELSRQPLGLRKSDDRTQTPENNLTQRMPDEVVDHPIAINNTHSTHPIRSQTSRKKLSG